jgi:hypothetical protein
MNYVNQLVDYISEHESEDFWTAIDTGDFDGYLSDTERELISSQGKSDEYELDLYIMRKLARYHIYAIAYLIIKGENYNAYRLLF